MGQVYQQADADAVERTLAFADYALAVTAARSGDT
jgi:hypothetical protein